jgi:hypothetical protein
MAAHKAVILKCDGCGTVTPSGGMCVLDLIHLAHPVISVADARSRAGQRGWSHTLGGKDLCDRCRPATRPHPKLHAITDRFHHRGDGA